MNLHEAQKDRYSKLVYILTIPVDVDNAREICEDLENEVLSTDDLKAHLAKNGASDSWGLYSLSEFMWAVNEGDDFAEEFISYIQIKD